MSKTKEAERQFNVIVNSIVSTQKIDPEIIRQHIKTYAEFIGVSYDLAHQAVTWKARDILIERIASI
jgi:methylmalonyl-CoA mutase cobalamin-binding subunit